MSSWRPVRPRMSLVGPAGPGIGLQRLAAGSWAPLVSPKASIHDPVHAAMSLLSTPTQAGPGATLAQVLVAGRYASVKRARVG